MSASPADQTPRTTLGKILVLVRRAVASQPTHVLDQCMAAIDEHSWGLEYDGTHITISTRGQVLIRMPVREFDPEGLVFTLED